MTLWAVAVPLPRSMGLSKQEYWSGLPCPPPGHLPNPVIEPSSLVSPALACMFFITSATWKPQIQYIPPKISFIFSLVPVLPSAVYDLVNDITQSRGATQTLSSLLTTSSPPSCTSVLLPECLCSLCPLHSCCQSSFKLSSSLPGLSMLLETHSCFSRRFHNCINQGPSKKLGHIPTW